LIFLELQCRKARVNPNGFLSRASGALPPEVEAEERRNIARVAVKHVPPHLQRHWMKLLKRLFKAHLKLLQDFSTAVRERRAPNPDVCQALHTIVLGAWREYCAVAGRMNGDPAEQLWRIVYWLDHRLHALPTAAEPRVRTADDKGTGDTTTGKA